MMLREAVRLEVEQAGGNLGLFVFSASSGTQFEGAMTVSVMTEENHVAFLLKVYSAETCSDWVVPSDESRWRTGFVAAVVLVVAEVLLLQKEAPVTAVVQAVNWHTVRCLRDDEHAYQPY